MSGTSLRQETRIIVFDRILESLLSLLILTTYCCTIMTTNTRLHESQPPFDELIVVRTYTVGIADKIAIWIIRAKKHMDESGKLSPRCHTPMGMLT
eukprot:scaffold14836_cov134-Cylindrotheca_fusiformis.AAC.3